MHSETKRNKAVLFIITAFFVLTTLSLSVWQWQRHKWKTAIIHRIHENFALDPTSLEGFLAELHQTKDATTLYGRKLLLSADINQEKLIGRFTSTQTSSQVTSLGVMVFAPVQFNDTALMLSLGVCNYKVLTSAKRAGTLRLENVLAVAAPLSGATTWIYNSNQNPWTVSKLESLLLQHMVTHGNIVLQIIDQRPITLDNEVELTPAQPNLVPNNPHKGYALTWLGLAIATLLFSLVLGGSSSSGKDQVNH